MQHRRDEAGYRRNDGEHSRLPAGAISLIKQGMDVTDGEQHISCSKDPQPRDDVTLPEDDKWFQGVLQARALRTTWGVMLTGPTLSTCHGNFCIFGAAGLCTLNRCVAPLWPFQ